MKFISIRVTAGEKVQFISDSPGVHFHFIENLIDSKVKSIHHPVLTFIDHPDRFSAIVKKLC